MSSLFTPATKQQSKLRMALVGPSGSGKTYTALNIAQHLGQRVAVIDTERGSARKYSDLFKFDVLELTTFSPDKYLEGIRDATNAGYDVLIIDSLSHAWSGRDGILEFVDKAAARSRSNNSFGAWRDATPLHNSLVDGILESGTHLIVTMRAKTEYVQEKDDRGKTSIRKVGMQPVQREGLEYEFDVVADLDMDNNLIVGKTRCVALAGHIVHQAGQEIASILSGWLSDGEPIPPPSPPPPAPVETITPPQVKALAIAIRELQFGDDAEGKDRGRRFVGWLAGVSNLESVMHLTLDQASRVLSRIGNGDNGAFRTDEVQLAEALSAWYEHLDAQRTPGAPAPAVAPETEPEKESPPPAPAAEEPEQAEAPAAELPDFDPHAKAPTTKRGRPTGKAVAGMKPIDPDDSKPIEFDEASQEGLPF